MRRGENAVRAARVTAALCLVAALTAACAGSKPAQRAAAASTRAAHPEVDADLEGCAGCHAVVTEEVTAQWTASRHGVALVKCFVCHGSTGSDFRARPEPTSCLACHAPQVASVGAGGAPARCFDCHPPHALRATGASPHPAAGPRT